MSIPYRREIDGLRAIAVTAVVLYHAGLGGAGFVGVDVFFVISGYLITALLLREYEATGRIDLLAFYARRVRRIMPAAVVVVLATLGIGSLLLPPDALARLANSAGAAAIFGANVYFHLTTGGYWDASAEQMPLLHLWSLSVEEQFYLAWPALLMLVPRKRLLPALIGLSVVSLLLAEWLIATHPIAAFYQTPARFWELAAGGIVAALPARAVPRWLAPAGLLVVVAACVLPVGHFPGLGALPAVLGAAALLHALRNGATSRILASTSFVGVGLISYSLYLWHWPLLAFYRATVIGEGSTSVRLELCAVAVLLAAASYRYVEQPFRRSTWPKGRLVLAGAGASIVVALGACAYGYKVQAEQFRPEAPDRALAIIAENDRPPKYARCHFGVNDKVGPVVKPGCESIPGVAPTVAVWGDSFGAAWQALAWEIAAREQRSAIAFTYEACPPFLGWKGEKDLPGDKLCREHNARVLPALAGFDTVVLAVHWEREMVNAEAEQAFRDTLKALAPSVRRVVIIGPSPMLPDLLPKCIRARVDCSVPRATFNAQAARYDALLAEAVLPYPNVEIADVGAFLCDATRCPGVRDGIALYSDAGHLSYTAATLYARQWRSH